MAGANLICRVCGKEYSACLSAKMSVGYNWKEVACCPEHGAEYLRLVLKSRGLLDNNEDENDSEQSNDNVLYNDVTHDEFGSDTYDFDEDYENNFGDT